MGRTGVRCRSVTVVLGGREVLSELSLEVGGGEMVALLGASGAGKTTLLGALAGFVPLAAGEIEIGGVQVASVSASVPPERRRVGVVFQDYALWPQMTARQIVAYPLVVRGVPRREAERRAERWLARVGLDGMAARRPGQLSGGQQQRVGLARALIAQPGLLLCDEPTANLDAVLRGGLQREIRAQQRNSGAAGVYVTHDPAEAFEVADRVAVLHRGRLAQVGPPWEIYARPSTAAVASLTGPYSLLRADAPEPGRAWVLGVEVDCGGGPGPETGSDAGPGSRPGPETGSCTRSVSGAQRVPGLGTGPGSGSGNGREVALLVRPEWVEIGPAGGPGLAARVLAAHYRGGYTDYDLESPAGRLQARAPGEPRRGAGEAVVCVPRRGWVLPDTAEVRRTGGGGPAWTGGGGQQQPHERPGAWRYDVEGG